MTTKYHKKKRNTHRHVHRYNVRKLYKKQNTDENAVKVRSPDGILAINTQDEQGDLIKAQVLKHSLNEEYYALDDYIENAIQEWKTWTSQLADRIYRIQSEHHKYLSLFEEQNHG